MIEPLDRFSASAGRFFFRWRNALFPVVFAAFLLFLRPGRIFAQPEADRLLRIAGLAVTLAGEGVRMATIGFEYIERGGKQGKVYASRLVRKGVYGVSRNPMYAGNLMIAAGIVMASGSPWAYVTVLPFFLFVYRAIVSAEEGFLNEKFGDEYRRYCEEVPRFLPWTARWREAFSGTSFDWRRPLKQDLSTLAWIALVLTALPAWRAYFLWGRPDSQEHLLATAFREGIVLALYGLLVVLKKRRAPLFYTRAEREELTA